MKKPLELAEWARSMAADSSNIDAPLFAEAAEQLEALSRIHAELDGVEWNSDTTSNIADHLAAVGLEPAPCDDDDDE